MRIAYFSDTFYPQVNGVVTSILNSSKVLAEKGNKIHIFTVKNDGPNIKLHKNIKVSRYIGVSTFKYSDFKLVIPDTLHFLKQIKKFKPDIIHIHTPTLLGWEGIAYAKLLDVPIVGTYHTLLPGFLKYSPIKINRFKFAKRLVWKYTNNFYDNCDIVTTPSEAMKKELIKNGIKSEVNVISNGINLNIFYPRIKKNKKFRILYVGRIGYEKKIDIAIKAVALFSKITKNFEFFIVGSGLDLDKIKRLVKKLNISKFTKFLKPIPNQRLPSVYSNSDVFLTGSTIETEGITLLEAMACGLPVIGVNALAVPNLIKDGRNGFVLSKGDYKSMSKAITNIYYNKKLREKIKRNNIKDVEKYDIHKCVIKFEHTYKSLLKN